MVDIGVEKHNHCLFSPILYESVLPNLLVKVTAFTFQTQPLCTESAEVGRD